MSCGTAGACSSASAFACFVLDFSVLTFCIPSWIFGLLILMNRIWGHEATALAVIYILFTFNLLSFFVLIMKIVMCCFCAVVILSFTLLSFSFFPSSNYLYKNCCACIGKSLCGCILLYLIG